MVSGFFGLHLASKALSAHQRAMEMTGHNIANVNTEGYSRQIADYTASTPLPPIFSGRTALQLGSGVEISQIRRARNQFLDGQVRLQSWIQGRWQIQKDILSQVEGIVNEPSDTSLSTTLNNFLNSWQELTTNPESLAIRSSVREKARTMTIAFGDTARQLARIQTDLNESVKNTITEINSFAKQIAELNSKINEVTALNGNPNDLMDKRDLLIEKMAKLVDVQVIGGKGNQANIFIYGKAIVREDSYTEIITEAEAVSSALDDITKLVSVKWDDDLTDVGLSDGKLQGILNSRDTILVKYASNLDTLVATLVEEFNLQHQAGYGLDGDTGIDFFEPSGLNAINFSISSEVDLNLRVIAAAGDDPTSVSAGPGDSANALLIAQLRYGATHNDASVNGSTYEDFYGSVIAALGVESAEAIRIDENQTFLLTQMDERRLAESGVSLDEEMANMIMYQRAYEAAARVVTAVDEMLDTIINRMGLVGR